MRRRPSKRRPAGGPWKGARSPRARAAPRRQILAAATGPASGECGGSRPGRRNSRFRGEVWLRRIVAFVTARLRYVTSGFVQEGFRHAEISAWRGRLYRRRSADRGAHRFRRPRDRRRADAALGVALCDFGAANRHAANRRAAGGRGRARGLRTEERALRAGRSRLPAPVGARARDAVGTALRRGGERRASSTSLRADDANQSELSAGNVFFWSFRSRNDERLAFYAFSRRHAAAASASVCGPSLIVRIAA